MAVPHLLCLGNQSLGLSDIDCVSHKQMIRAVLQCHSPYHVPPLWRPHTPIPAYRHPPLRSRSAQNLFPSLALRLRAICRSRIHMVSPIHPAAARRDGPYAAPCRAPCAWLPPRFGTSTRPGYSRLHAQPPPKAWLVGTCACGPLFASRSRTRATPRRDAQRIGHVMASPPPVVELLPGRPTPTVFQRAVARPPYSHRVSMRSDLAGRGKGGGVRGIGLLRLHSRPQVITHHRPKPMARLRPRLPYIRLPDRSCLSALPRGGCEGLRARSRRGCTRSFAARRRAHGLVASCVYIF